MGAPGNCAAYYGPARPCVGDSTAMDVDTLATIVMLAYTPIAGALASLTILHFSKR